MTRLSLLTVLLLSACGVDGPPIPPEPKDERPRSGLTVSGTVGVGVSGGSTQVDF
jgi:hypothetical protein